MCVCFERESGGGGRGREREGGKGREQVDKWEERDRYNLDKKKWEEYPFYLMGWNPAAGYPAFRYSVPIPVSKGKIYLSAAIFGASHSPSPWIWLKSS